MPGLVQSSNSPTRWPTLPLLLQRLCFCAHRPVVLTFFMDLRPSSLWDNAYLYLRSRKLVSRSTHGCWTCRLRKKKCDENHPSCFRCTSLRIACGGYGPMPYWMDRGDLQRGQARYKTHVIAQIKSAMRENELPGTSQNVEHE